jgi:hypothetical protein
MQKQESKSVSQPPHTQNTRNTGGKKNAITYPQANEHRPHQYKTRKNPEGIHQ